MCASLLRSLKVGSYQPWNLCFMIYGTLIASVQCNERDPGNLTDPEEYMGKFFWALDICEKSHLRMISVCEYYLGPLVRV